eukprot:TRINITY_DN54915_c0_g1_i1.p1 TRINITY_DN54915_c0_g1~~TRINITY_DN54915_c0_g1_i1.p1  ORF type:complete len:1035 (+),score=195.15 TRINITY_DN54915_c0_g1_i1:56-3160(+)
MTRNVVVFIENLTNHEFHPRCALTATGDVQALSPFEVIRRTLRLAWRVGSAACSVAVSFNEVEQQQQNAPPTFAPAPSPAPASAAGAGYSAGGGEGHAASPPGKLTGRQLFVAFELPALQEGFEGWISRVSFASAASPRFGASLLACARGGDHLGRALEAAPILANGRAEGCEWLVARRDSELLEIRVRILPAGGASELPPLEPVLPVEAYGAASGATAAKGDEACDEELERLRCHRALEKIKDQQAIHLLEQMNSERVDLERVQRLPQKTRSSLLIALMHVMHARNESAMTFLTSTSDECQRGLIDSVSDAVDSGLDVEACAKLKQILQSQCKHVYSEILPLFALDDPHEMKKVADLISLICSDDLASGCSVNPRSMCVSVRNSMNRDGHRKVVTDSSWSASKAERVGSESEVVSHLKDACLLDEDVSTSVAEAVEALSSGAYPCAQKLCICYDGAELKYHLITKGEPIKSDAADKSDSTAEKRELGADGETIVSHPSSGIPYAWIVARDIVATFLGAKGGIFNARTRISLLCFTSKLGVPMRVVAKWEEEIGSALFQMLEASTVLEQQRDSMKSWNRGKVALAAAGGGLLLAVTGGLAAPAVATGFTALGASATAAGAYVGFTTTGIVIGSTIAGLGVAITSLGTAGAVVLFGATGAGLAGFKLANRWGNLEDFAFIPLSERTVNTSLSICNKAAIRTLDEALRKGQGELLEDVVVKDGDEKPVPLLRGSKLQKRNAEAVKDDSTGSTSEGVRFDFQRKIDSSSRAVHLVVFASGWLRDGEDDFTRPWADIANLYFPSSGHLALRWEAEKLMQLNDLVSGQVKREVLSTSASWWFKASTASTLAYGSLAATAAWPISIVCALSNLDNAWIVCTERAKLAGQCLASILADRKTAGRRPVTLIGHSMGARMLFYCCLELFQMEEFDVVQDVIFLGMPVTTRASKWRQVRAVTAGRVVNAFLPSDWMLGFLYRYLEWGITVAGLSKVLAPGVENVDLSGLGIEGHSDYVDHLPDIMAKVRLGDRLPPSHDEHIIF